MAKKRARSDGPDEVDLSSVWGPSLYARMVRWQTPRPPDLRVDPFADLARLVPDHEAVMVKAQFAKAAKAMKSLKPRVLKKRGRPFKPGVREKMAGLIEKSRRKNGPPLRKVPFLAKQVGASVPTVKRLLREIRKTSGS